MARTQGRVRSRHRRVRRKLGERAATGPLCPRKRVRRFVLPCGNRRNCKAIRSRTVFLAQFADIGNASVRREQAGLDTTAKDEGNDRRRSEVDASDGSTAKKVAYRSLPAVPEKCRATRVPGTLEGRTRPEAFVLQRPLRDSR